MYRTIAFGIMFFYIFVVASFGVYLTFKEYASTGDNESIMLSLMFFGVAIASLLVTIGTIV